jgi:hypothetical protein
LPPQGAAAVVLLLLLPLESEEVEAAGPEAGLAPHQHQWRRLRLRQRNSCDALCLPMT